jgi:hypothetical protein
MKRTSLALALGIATSLVAACADASAPAEEISVAVEPGKADNYLSPTSREYFLSGTGDETLDAATAPADDAGKEAAVRELLQFRFKAYAHFINAYVTNKGHDDANKDYGGFGGLVRGSTLDFGLTPTSEDKLAWRFTWQFEMGGPSDMLDDLSLETAANGEQFFNVQLPKLDATALRNETYPKDFDPATYVGTLETLRVTVRAEDRSIDSYPLYEALADDGKIQVLLVIGGDYNDARYDLKSAATHIAWLKSAGFAHTAKVYTDLKLDSLPFTKTIDMNGTKVVVEVTFLYGDIVPVDQLDQLRAAIIAGFGTADVVIYDGHAWLDPDYSGIVYHYNPRFAISATELSQLALPAKYQIYWFNGCKTYGAYPETVYKNAQKDFENLDVVSTVSFSWLSQQTFTTSGFLTELLSIGQKTHDPRTWSEILTRVNQKNNYNVYYGVHGIDDNPHVNPYADLATLCRPCTKKSQCPGAGNHCLTVGTDTAKFCAVECTDDGGCPEGYKCGDIATSGRISGRQCVPTDHTCP